MLEVMIALAIMGMSLLLLFQAQTRSMRLAEKARTLTIATELARKRLIDCQFDLTKQGLGATDYEETGDFGEEGYKDYTWECFAYRFDMPPPSAEAIADGMKAQSKGGGIPGMGSPGTGGQDFSASMLAPFFGLISTTMGDSVRELSVIVRWKNGDIEEELKVVTHVIDRTAMARLAAQLPDTPYIPGVTPPPGPAQPGGPAQPPGRGGP